MVLMIITSSQCGGTHQVPCRERARAPLHATALLRPQLLARVAAGNPDPDKLTCAGPTWLGGAHSTARVGRPPMAPRVWHQGLRRLQAARAEGRTCACAEAGRRTAGMATRHRRRPLGDGRRKRMPRKRQRRRGPRRGALRSCSARACLHRARQQRWAPPRTPAPCAAPCAGHRFSAAPAKYRRRDCVLAPGPRTAPRALPETVPLRGLLTDVLTCRAWRKEIEEEERKMDPDLRDSTQNIIDWVKCRLYLMSLPCF
jgi:hypothetical protein